MKSSLSAAALLAALPAAAQEAPPAPLTSAGNRAGENAVRQAGDAFGTVIGREEIGIYDDSDVRGFSPRVAGNVRIAGLYFDPVFFPSDRISGSTVIRVGPTQLGSPFPSPTGVVDLGLRVPGDKAGASILANVDSWGTRMIEADIALPVSDAFSLGLGGQINLEHMGDGTRDYYYEGAAIARWRPAPGIEIVPFISLAYTPFHEAATIYVPDGDVLPPRLPRNFWNGPAWQRTRETELNAGAVADADLGGGWGLKAGLFRSSIKYFEDYTNLLTDVQADGSARAQVIVDPPLLFGSTSGEVRLTRAWLDGERTHRLHLAFRGRDAQRRFGGAPVVDLGPTTLDRRITTPQPQVTFGAQERDAFRQWTLAAGYEGKWDGVGELSLGLQRTDYFKRIGLPGVVPVTTRTQPLLFNANAAVVITSRLAAYGGYVTGLEESGVAPEQAANRNEALPAIRTRQFDAGLRWNPAGELRLVIGLFEIAKPYFNLDAANRFRQLGDVRNRGLEASFSGPITRHFSVVAGAVLLDPRVTADVPGVGRRPVGAIKETYTISGDWRPPWLPGVSFDASAYHISSQTATVSNRVAIPALTFVDLGGRYRFRLAGAAATLRVQVENLLDQQGYELFGAGAYRPVWGRAGRAYLTVDL
ncbi:TonB-dependent receptor domain-containing protein [Sandarakinorhabdus rubra]|uniref:TonB-dependent receptor domain-containing protein n=1 Tax=Sandarakinorhabdus rubra TaxID=2672568 RepID=UPI0013DA1384|nr:TonB-dependent receptor [Sandarakinorhabdus rubra]